MEILKKIYEFVEKHLGLIKIVSACVLSLAFIGSIAYSVLSGGELNQTQMIEDARGLISIIEAKYQTNYFVGEPFSFDKETAKVQLFAKDPLIENMVLIDELPSSEYGFKVNGEGDIYENPSDIILSKDVTSIDLVSVVYENIKTTIDVKVLTGLDSEKLTSSLLYEAEVANVYKDDNLLDEEAMKTQPNTEKPYLSNQGSVVDGLSCSGGACLRNFQSNNMTVEFIIISSEKTEAQLTVGCCKRKESVSFGDWFKVQLNGENLTDLTSQIMPAGTGYFEPYTLNAITVTLNRGINYITFKSGSSNNTANPGNLDFIKLDSSSNVLGTTEAIVE